jgi:hypothetical protein
LPIRISGAGIVPLARCWCTVAGRMPAMSAVMFTSTRSSGAGSADSLGASSTVHSVSYQRSPSADAGCRSAHLPWPCETWRSLIGRDSRVRPGGPGHPRWAGPAPVTLRAVTGAEERFWGRSSVALIRLHGSSPSPDSVSSRTPKGIQEKKLPRDACSSFARQIVGDYGHAHGRSKQVDP